MILSQKPSAEPATLDQEKGMTKIPTGEAVDTACIDVSSFPRTALADKEGGHQLPPNGWEPSTSTRLQMKGMKIKRTKVEIIRVDKEGSNGIKKKSDAEIELKIEDIFANTEEGEDKWSPNGLPKKCQA